LQLHKQPNTTVFYKSEFCLSTFLHSQLKPISIKTKDNEYSYLVQKFSKHLHIDCGIFSSVYDWFAVVFNLLLLKNDEDILY